MDVNGAEVELEKITWLPSQTLAAENCTFGMACKVMVCAVESLQPLGAVTTNDTL